jgi:hypothetical protein
MSIETKDYFTGGLETSYYPFSFKDNECFSFTNKDNNLSEQILQSNYWREQINLYGQRVDYYVNNFTLSSSDLLYGEEPTQQFSIPQRIKMAINLNDNALMLSKYGLLSEDEVTAFVHISGFYETFGWDREPKSGDVFQLWEFGRGRPGGRNGKFFEITERLDEDVATINTLGGHYVWLIKAKRFEWSFEPGLSGEAVNGQVYDDVKPPNTQGANKPYNFDINQESKVIFDYSKTDYSDVYGGYY